MLGTTRGREYECMLLVYGRDVRTRQQIRKERKTRIKVKKKKKILKNKKHVVNFKRNWQSK